MGRKKNKLISDVQEDDGDYTSDEDNAECPEILEERRYDKMLDIILKFSDYRNNHLISIGDKLRITHLEDFISKIEDNFKIE